VQKGTRRYSAQTARHDLSCTVNPFLCIRVCIRGVNVLPAQNYFRHDLHAQSTSSHCAVDCTYTKPMKHFHIQIIEADHVVDYHPCLLEKSRIAPLNKLRKLEPAALTAFEKNIPVLVNFIEYIQFAFNERASVLTCKHCFRKNAS